MSRPHFTENQLELLDLLWRLKEANGQQIHQELSPERELAPATVATPLNRLCKDRVVERVHNGRQFLRRPRSPRAPLQSNM